MRATVNTLSARRFVDRKSGEGHSPPKTSSPSRTWGPREMFSCAGRAVFLGAILTVIRWSWTLRLLFLRMHQSTVAYQNFDGCGEECPTDPGGEGKQKAGQHEIPGSSPKYLRTLAPLSANTSSFFLSPPSEFSFLDPSRNRQLSNAAKVDNPERWLPRMPHPNSFL